MSDKPKQVTTTLAHKAKLLAKASVWATWYSAAAFLPMLLVAMIYDERIIDDLHMTWREHVFFFMQLEIMWLFSLMLIGLPVWMLIEKLGFIRKIHFRIVGTIAPAIIGLPLYMIFNPPWDWMMLLSLFYIGNIIGKHLWERSYKQPEIIMPV